MTFKNQNQWAIILGGSSGFGMATAHKLSQSGFNLVIVHRDRKGSMAKINEQFEILRQNSQLITFNCDALDEEIAAETVQNIAKEIGTNQVRLLLHSIAFGNLKLLVGQQLNGQGKAVELLASRLGVSVEKVTEATDSLFEEGHDDFVNLATAPSYNNDTFLEKEDLQNTIFAMGTSLATWVRLVFDAHLFTEDARIIGLTSEGNEVAWRGYAAVSAAKVSLEAIIRSIALEYAPYGLRANIVQPGVTNTPALRLIPGSRHLAARAKQRNPFKRLTQTEDVANVISLLCSDEAAWINGSLIRVDGGEHIVG